MRAAFFSLIVGLLVAIETLSHPLRPGLVAQLSRRGSCLSCLPADSHSKSPPGTHYNSGSSSHTSSTHTSPSATKHPPGPFRSPTSSPTSSSKSSSSSTPTSGDDHGLRSTTNPSALRLPGPGPRFRLGRGTLQHGYPGPPQRSYGGPLGRTQHRPQSTVRARPRHSLSTVKDVQFGAFRKPTESGHHGRGKATVPPASLATKMPTSAALPPLRIGRPAQQPWNKGKGFDKGQAKAVNEGKAKAVDKGKGKAIASPKSSSSSDSSPEKSHSPSHKLGGGARDAGRGPPSRM